MSRSAAAEVRNPVLALPAVARLRALPVESRRELAATLKDLSSDARHRAQKAWDRNKAPMAVYWKAVAVYARHIGNAIR